MRLATLVLCIALVAAVAPVLVAPTASACTGDPSVCGVMRDAKCIQREGVEDAVDCVKWL